MVVGVMVVDVVERYKNGRIRCMSTRPEPRVNGEEEEVFCKETKSRIEIKIRARIEIESKDSIGIKVQRVIGHTKTSDSSPETPRSPSGRTSPDVQGNTENRDLKSPIQTEQYLREQNMTDQIPIPGIHEMPMLYNNDEGRMMQPPFAFPPLMINPQQIDNSLTTDLRVMTAKNANFCPCEANEDKSIVYRSQSGLKNKSDDSSDHDTDTEIDLTSHSSRDDDFRECSATPLTNGAYRGSDAVLDDAVPNDLSLGSAKNLDNPRNSVTST
ncbi:hypothetical protein EVAR_33689_1 [Eumeta japonica]|uniref:Uncharacterized protein n=1 Tax=Eumeta variegata TaxID=151549 RepID=A0A4C1VN33_EUMVA|nr:hypothetical protein EVAR_33689_1 [Eumeta japonica]